MDFLTWAHLVNRWTWLSQFVFKIKEKLKNSKIVEIFMEKASIQF
jgi:hypothetical protein